MVIRIAIQTRMSEIVVCHCAACDQHPDPKYPEFGGMVRNAQIVEFGAMIRFGGMVRQIPTNVDGTPLTPDHWWCEWCLSCGCHDVDEFGELMLPNCSTERFGFPDEPVAS